MRVVLLFIVTLVVDESDGTSLDIAVALAKYANVLFKVDEVILFHCELLNHLPLLGVMNLVKFRDIVFKLFIFGYLLPTVVIIIVTIITCWYIRDEIRSLYPMLVPFPVAKKACERYLAKMDKKLIQALIKKQEEERNTNRTITTESTMV
ncbi:unnamed protein product [Thelazia callipaeda]|uniref:Chloride channel CLIC-like protein 1 n=1 Tax=Thelazia callipaeda TaxID=103827 RepID=A0A0N5DAP4_THECL|nr:unnamed protein product [Thelazia callipaeda]